MAVENQQEAERIERDIEHTQDRIGDTVDKLEEKMTPREITRSALGDEGQMWAREALQLARDNPIPVAMIAVGAIWLFATSSSPLINRVTDRVAKRSEADRKAPPAASKRPPEAAAPDLDRRAAPGGGAIG